MQVKESSVAYQKKKKIYTYQDYLELPDDRNRYEILEGELIMSPAPSTIHQDVSGNIVLELKAFVRKNDLGKIYYAPYDVVLSKHTIVQPDLLFVTNENKKIITEKNIQGAPDLIIEILSPATAYHDLVEKKKIYQQFGVKEYWIVDPKMLWIEVYVLEEGKYQLFQRSEKSGTVQSKIIAGFEIPLSKIFEQEEK